MTYIRTRFGQMRYAHGWNFNVDKDFSFQGGLLGRLDRLIQERKTEMAQLGIPYGDGTNRSIIRNVRTVGQLDWSVFNKDDPVQHQQKVIGLFGSSLGMRGSSEHTNFERRHIERGVFSAPHPVTGEEYWGI